MCACVCVFVKVGDLWTRPAYIVVSYLAVVHRGGLLPRALPAEGSQLRHCLTQEHVHVQGGRVRCEIISTPLGRFSISLYAHLIPLVQEEVDPRLRVKGELVVVVVLKRLPSAVLGAEAVVR